MESWSKLIKDALDSQGYLLKENDSILIKMKEDIGENK